MGVNVAVVSSDARLAKGSVAERLVVRGHGGQKAACMSGCVMCKIHVSETGRSTRRFNWLLKGLLVLVNAPLSGNLKVLYGASVAQHLKC